MNELTKYMLYFVLGGSLVSISTYWGAHGKGFLAAFASTVPVISGVTFILIYLNAGTVSTVSFAKHLIWLSPAWFVYVIIMMVGTPRLGFWMAFPISLALYFVSIWLLNLILR